MTDSISEAQEQKVLLLSPDEEQARLIGKAIASETAGKILTLMAGREVTASNLVDEIGIPVSTVMYHLENLTAAGLIEVSRIRYSVKGREMKVYRIVDQVLIVSSKGIDIRKILTRYAAIFSLPVLAALLFSSFHQTEIPMYADEMADTALRGGYTEMESETLLYAKEIASPPALAPAPTISSDAVEPLISVFPFQDIAIGILIGALLVLIPLLLLEVSSLLLNRGLKEKKND